MRMNFGFMMRLSVGLLFAPLLSIGQTDTPSLIHIAPQPQQIKTNVPKTIKPKPISKEMSLGVRASTNGWSIFTDYGKSAVVDSRHGDRFYHVKLFQFEFTENKSPRELKSSSGAITSSGNSSSYVYGKINSFYAVKLGYGYRKMIAGKPDYQGAVSIHWVNAGGLAIGILKPYYLNLTGSPVPVKYADNNSGFLDPNEIVSSAGFSKGLSEAKIIPGAHFKTALHFDCAGSLKNVIAIEAGFSAEFYSQQIQIMAIAPATNYFANAYLSFQLGTRW